MTPQTPRSIARLGGGIRAVVFDFDNTLVDASEAICHSFQSALATRGHPVLSTEAVRAMIGRPLVEMFARTLPGATDEEVRACVDRYREVFLPISLQMSRPLPALRKCLDRLAPSCRMAIATNRTSNSALHILEGFGLLPYFKAVIGIDGVQRTKPHPEAIRAALARLDAAPEEAVTVGDTVEDIEAGRAAGTATVAITTGFCSRARLEAARPDALIDRLDELPALLGKEPPSNPPA